MQLVTHEKVSKKFPYKIYYSQILKQQQQQQQQQQQNKEKFD